MSKDVNSQLVGRLRITNSMKTTDEVPRLLEEYPEYLRRIIVCALNTGMRRQEILTLKWPQIRDGLIYLKAQDTKTKEPRQIPINDDLKALFDEIKQEQQSSTDRVYGLDGKPIKKRSLSSGHIFLYRGNTVKNVKKSCKTALKESGVKDFRFHDLRHTFASHFLMRGGNLKELQEILGHKDIKMTIRYAHLTQEHKRRAINLLNGPTSPRNVPRSESALFPARRESISV